MHYKTIVLELLQQIPELHDRLRASRTLLSTLDQLAAELKTRQEEWQTKLARTNPDNSAAQIASAAMELALSELEAALRPASPRDGDDPPSLDGAMAYLRRHSPPA